MCRPLPERSLFHGQGFGKQNGGIVITRKIRVRVRVHLNISPYSDEYGKSFLTFYFCEQLLPRSYVRLMRMPCKVRKEKTKKKERKFNISADELLKSGTRQI
ncbi:hypothetical protein TWF706_002361 [Orbilia oligospora]|nr:hypothetical protein TWF706_002361 [Orbilia oligospora]